MLLAAIVGVEGSVFEILPQSVDVVPVLLSCRSTRDVWQPCSCSFSLRLEWYPSLLYTTDAADE